MATDVNEAFKSERAEQLRDAADRQSAIEQRVRAGTLTPLGGDRYRINDATNWDDGEVVTLSGGQLVAEHGLDETTGRAALYSAVPAWHGLGAVIPGGTTSIDEVLQLARIDWQVEKRPALYDWQDETRTAADKYLTVRADTGAALGAVGRTYRVFQQREIFEFLQDLSGQYDAVWQSAGALRGGRRLFVTMRIPHSIIIDRGGLDDSIDLFLAAINSHDGTSAAESVVTPWRIVCGNTERFALRDARARWGIRHTQGGLDRLQEARRTLGLTLDYAKSFEAEETQLARTDILLDEFHALIDGLWPVADDATDRMKDFATKRHAELDDMFRTETERAGRTAYAAERTITDFLDHRTRVVPKSLTEDLARAQRALEGADDALKTQAHRRLMALRTT